MRPDLQHSPALPGSRRFSAAEKWSEAWGDARLLLTWNLFLSGCCFLSPTHVVALKMSEGISLQIPPDAQVTVGARCACTADLVERGALQVRHDEGRLKTSVCAERRVSISEYTRKPPSMQQRSSLTVLVLPRVAPRVVSHQWSGF